MTAEDPSEQAWYQAMEDAMILGLGVVVIRPDMRMERIGPERYLEMAEALKNPPEHYKPLPKE